MMPVELDHQGVVLKVAQDVEIGHLIGALRRALVTASTTTGRVGSAVARIIGQAPCAMPRSSMRPRYKSSLPASDTVVGPRRDGQLKHGSVMPCICDCASYFAAPVMPFPKMRTVVTFDKRQNVISPAAGLIDAIPTIGIADPTPSPAAGRERTFAC